MLVLAVMVTIVLLGASAVHTGGPGHPGPAGGPGGHGAESAVRRGAFAGPDVLQVTPAPYQLSAPVSREVLLPVGRGHKLLVVGGLDATSSSSATVSALDAATGSTRLAGQLASPTHDAGGAILGGRVVVFGGGSSTSVATVQALGAGRGARAPARAIGALPRARSDVGAVTIGATAYLVGGYDGSTYDPEVLATKNGTQFSNVARLPVPVRYAALAVLGDTIWVFGGETTSGPTAAVQEVNPASGRATVVAQLAHPLEGASTCVLDGRIFLFGGEIPAPRGASPAGAPTGLVTSRAVVQFQPATLKTTSAGELPVPVAYGAAAVVHTSFGPVAYVVGGEDAGRPVPSVTTLRLVPQAHSATPLSASSSPWLAPVRGPGHLLSGSDPSVLPGDVLIADHKNNRLVIVDPQGRVRWTFPHRGCLAPGQRFLEPDDAFFSPNGKEIIATQEDDFVISVIDVKTCHMVYRYGTPGVPGSGPNHVDNPDDAMLTPKGRIVAADIKNCRIITIAPPAHHLLTIVGRTTSWCFHDPPHRFGSPNGAFPLTDRNYLVTEIDGDWADEMSLAGHVVWSTHPPGVTYPSDTNEIAPGRYLTADYSDPGQVVEFDRSGHLLWRMGGLNRPSLALPLPNGDILVNDDYNDRVIVIDPSTDRIVWQYGHTGTSGRAPGYLNDPDGVDLVPPDSMLISHATTMGEP